MIQRFEQVRRRHRDAGDEPKTVEHGKEQIADEVYEKDPQHAAQALLAGGIRAAAVGPVQQERDDDEADQIDLHIERCSHFQHSFRQALNGGPISRICTKSYTYIIHCFPCGEQRLNVKYLNKFRTMRLFSLKMRKWRSYNIVNTGKI